MVHWSTAGLNLTSPTHKAVTMFLMISCCLIGVVVLTSEALPTIGPAHPNRATAAKKTQRVPERIP